MTDKQNPQDQTPEAHADLPENAEPASGADLASEPKGNIPGEPQSEKPKLGAKAWKDIFLYGFFRLVLFIVLTVVIHSIVILLGLANFFPLLMSALLALILALPLSMLMFGKLRRRVNEQIAVWDSKRRAYKQELAEQLQDRMYD